MDLRSFFEFKLLVLFGVVRHVGMESDELNFQTKVELACMARANELLTHCTLGVPLKCQASVERLVATGRRPNTPLTWFHTNTTPLNVW